MAAPVFANIPDVLKLRAQWVCWKLEAREGDDDEGAKLTKIPYSPKTGRKASSDKPATWGEYDRAVQAWESSQSWKGKTPYTGVGYVFSPDDPFAGLDIDGCIDLDSGEVLGWAESMITRLDSYAEVSPSGTGVKIIVEARKPGPKCRRIPHLEFYDSFRFFTITGKRYLGAPKEINARQDVYSAIYHETFPPSAPSARVVVAGQLASIDDNTVLEAAFRKRSGQVRDLWHGGCGGHLKKDGSPDWSSADMALANELAFYCRGDAGQVERLMRASALVRPKWDRRASGTLTYLDLTIRKAIADRKGDWTPPRSQWPSPPPANRYTATSTTPVGGDVVDVAGGASPAKEGVAAPDPADFDRERVESLAQLDALPRDGNELPAIETNNKHMREQFREFHGHLVAANDPPQLFLRDTTLVRVDADTSARPYITEHNINTLRHRQIDVCKFVSTSERRGTVAVPVTDKLLSTYLAAGDWPEYPVLDRIVGTPVFDKHGNLVATEGYHPASRVYYHPDGNLVLGNTDPSPANCKRSVDLLMRDMMGDFPFADDASKAHILCLALLPFARAMIDGHTPLHLLDAPAAGTGKSLIGELCCRIFDPTLEGMFGAPKTDEELDKVLAGKLLKGAPSIFIDNARWLRSDYLFSALTSEKISVRALGGSSMTSVANTFAWVVSCNNMTGDDQLVRRSVLVRLDSGLERPAERSGWRIPNIREWSKRHRSELVTACITIVGAWINAGKPNYSGDLPPLGSFESWFSTMGGILDVAQVPGFGANREVFQQRASTDDAGWYPFVAAWREKYPGGPSQTVTAAELFDVALLHIPDKLGDGSERSQRTKLGKQLGKMADRIFDGYCIRRAGLGTSGESRNIALYCLEKASGNRPDGVAEPPGEVQKTVPVASKPVSLFAADVQSCAEVFPLPPCSSFLGSDLNIESGMQRIEDGGDSSLQTSDVCSIEGDELD